MITGSKRMSSMERLKIAKVMECLNTLPCRTRAVNASPSRFFPRDSGSLDEWLMERYTAFTAAGDGPRRFFRVWHPAWRQAKAKINVSNQSLLDMNWPLFREARY